MPGPLDIGGLPVVTLTAAPAEGPRFCSAQILPGRGMMILQARAFFPGLGEIDVLHAPTVADAAQRLDGGASDFAGNAAFGFGGAILLPYANRIRGQALRSSREIEAQVDGHTVRLPRNWGGKAQGAEQYAMHGLILDVPVPFQQSRPNRVSGRLYAGDFGGRWPGMAEAAFEWRLKPRALTLHVTVTNTGESVLPIGLGWHPYFALPSGRREQARLTVPAKGRLEVNDYDEVLPTGRVLPVAGTAYDLSEGPTLGEFYLDDCFVDLDRPGGEAIIELSDPAAAYGLRLRTASSQVQAVQVYAPPDQAFVVIEPQFNWADPYGAIWPDGTDTGMTRLAPGASIDYEVRVELRPA